MDYTVTLTETQKKAMEYAALDVGEWITNAATARAEIAIGTIIDLNTKYCNENSLSIAVGIDAQVTQAYELGVVKTAAQQNAENAE